MKLSLIDGARLQGKTFAEYGTNPLDGLANRLNGIDGLANRLNGLANRLNGVSEEDLSAFQLAYALGDPDALAIDGDEPIQGLKSFLAKRKARRSAKKAEREAKRATRKGRREEKKEIRMNKLREGGRFIDKVGDLASGLADKFRGDGIDADPELLQDLDDQGILKDLATGGEDPGGGGTDSEKSEGGDNKMILLALGALVAAKLFKVF